MKTKSKSRPDRATNKELRSTGLVVGIALAVLAVLQLLFHGRFSRPPVLWGILGASALLLLLAWLAPPLLRPFHYLWMKFSSLLGWVMNRVILAVLFFVFFTFFGVIGRLFRGDKLDLGPRKDRESFWNPRPEAPAPKERYERQF